ncbi:AsmA-like C-terminal region-containing protein [Adhaeribacter radiodurans]|uniref:AsmA family protein n=1 Tax=Adhaeribacter radiodurans TaxID=2745197 RepID=A0A7L7LE08_9BACT|nr:AsmA-like C-terminal region-containing protein [Adhaeribacter radiodurans]QMU31068.1 hypothetical protein HUW48_24945 [Adhaeribacter radiodurans]
MKKVFIGFVIFIVVLIAAAALTPYLFKDKIKQVLDKQIAKNVKAKVLYQTDNVSISLFRDFPNLALSIDDLTIIGQDSFQRDTLAMLPNFSMGLDLMSVIAGDKLKVRSVKLQDPRLKLKVLKSGRANWDIFITDTTQVETPADTVNQFNMAIKGWEINNGTLVYEDLSIPFRTEAFHVNHNGSGDFEQNVFDMKSRTTADGFTFNYAGLDYLDSTRLDADITLAMDLNQSKYMFKENNIKVNEFGLGLDGSVQMPGDDINMDLTFKSADNDFKSILSIVPGIFTEKFKNIKTEGKVAFNGYVKGTLNDTSMPGFGTDLKVSNAMFKYPDLPQAATNINIDMNVDNKDGVINNTNVLIRKMHLDLGKNPVDAKASIQGLEPMKVDGNVKANIDLAEMTKVFPVEGMTLRGLLFVDAVAKGTYTKTQMPVVNAKMNLTNGFVKAKQFPAPIQNLNLVSTITNTTGNTDDTKVLIERFNMLLDGEPLEGRVAVQNIAKPAFDARIKGILDLTKITKIFPLEGTTLSGRINADVTAKGKMTDIDAGKYDNITSSGSMQVTNLNYKSTDLPQGMKITTANTVFNNEKIQVNNFKGFIGKSDVQLDGSVSNYMGYLFGKNQPLRGNFTMNSSRFDVNEWMVDELNGEPVPPEAEGGIIPVPENLDVVLNTTANQVVYDNLNLSNLKGTVTLRDQVAKLDGVSFNALGGSFVTNGSYNTKNLQHPGFTFGLNIKNLDFKSAYNAFNTIKVLAPIAQFLDGKFSTNFNFNGELGPDMMPVYKTLTGKGLIEVVKAVVQNNVIVNRISEVTNFKELQNFSIENKGFSAEIVGGNLVVKPFDFTVKDIKTTVSGTNGIDGSLTYALALDVPTGKVGNALNAKLVSLTGVKDIKGTERVTMNLNVGGTVTNPKVSLSTASAKNQAKQVVQSIVQEKVDVAKQRLEQEKQKAEDSIRAEVNRRRLEAEAKAKEEIAKRTQQAEQKLKQQASEKLNNLFNKRKPTADTSKKQ